MIVFPCSDFHFEFEPHAFEPMLDSLPDADVIAVAGDLCTLGYGLTPILRELGDRYSHVVFVAGNHEYYDATPHTVATIREAIYKPCVRSEWENIHWLDKSAVEIEGQRFVGCTLWFKETPGNQECHPSLADFRCIDQFVPWVYEENERCLAYLASEVQPGDFVITHHLPSMRSSDPTKYDVETTRRFFVSDGAEAIIQNNQPRVWLHGHTHSFVDYQIGETSVICNPRGYKTDTEFNPDYKLTIR